VPELGRHGDRTLPTLLLEPAGGIEEDAAEWLELLGGLSVMRILTSRDCDIRRMGSLQSRISIPAAEVICVAFTMNDGLFQLGESAS
jgi:hypothetical protein